MLAISVSDESRSTSRVQPGLYCMLSVRPLNLASGIGNRHSDAALGGIKYVTIEFAEKKLVFVRQHCFSDVYVSAILFKAISVVFNEETKYYFIYQIVSHLAHY